MFFQLKPGGAAEVEMINNSNKMDSFFIRVMRGWITSGQKIQHLGMGCKWNPHEKHRAGHVLKYTACKLVRGGGQFHFVCIRELSILG